MDNNKTYYQNNKEKWSKKILDTTHFLNIISIFYNKHFYL